MKQKSESDSIKEQEFMYLEQRGSKWSEEDTNTLKNKPRIQ